MLLFVSVDIGLHKDKIHYAKPTPKGDQAVFAHTIKAPAPSLSLGGGSDLQS